jgi:hypothetical protein
MHILICRYWTATLHGPHDWGEHPLGVYTMSDEFLESISDCPQRSLQRVAWVCATLACGRLQAVRALGARQRSGDRPGEELLRADGASGWECPLGHSHGELRLRYWIHTDGTLEFDALVGTCKHATDSHERLRRPWIKRRP